MSVPKRWQAVLSLGLRSPLVLGPARFPSKHRLDTSNVVVCGADGMTAEPCLEVPPQNHDALGGELGGRKLASVDGVRHRSPANAVHARDLANAECCALH